MELLRRRFEQLSPDEDDLVSRSVFQRPPYSSDPFCRQVWPSFTLSRQLANFVVQIWKRLSGEMGAPDKINFSSFVKTMIWWEKAPANFKLECEFVVCWATLEVDWDRARPTLEVDVDRARGGMSIGNVLSRSSMQRLPFNAESSKMASRIWEIYLTPFS